MSRLSTFRRFFTWLAVGASLHLVSYAQSAIQPLSDISQAAKAYVTSQVPASASVKITVGTLDPRLRLSPCATPLQASLPPGAAIRARVTVAVSCTGSWKIYVPATIETQSAVLVLRRAAARGERLTAADVQVQSRVVMGTGDGYLTEVAQLAGRTLKRPMDAGAALTVEAMMADMVVKRGQQVTLLAMAGGIEVRAPGLALSDGPANGRIKAQNLSSHRIVEGVVASADVIRVTP